jgi:hypothetical protein
MIDCTFFDIFFSVADVNARLVHIVWRASGPPDTVKHATPSQSLVKMAQQQEPSSGAFAQPCEPRSMEHRDRYM